MDNIQDKELFNEFRNQFKDELIRSGNNSITAQDEAFGHCMSIAASYLIAFKECSTEKKPFYKKMHSENKKSLEQALHFATEQNNGALKLEIKKALAQLELEPVYMFADPHTIRNRFICDVADLFLAITHSDWASSPPTKAESNKLTSFVSLVCGFVFNPEIDSNLSRDQYAIILRKYRSLIKTATIGE